MTVIITCLFVLIIGAFLWLLFTPLVLTIDSSQHLYQIRLGRLIKFHLETDSDTVLGRCTIGFWQKKWDLLQFLLRPKTEEKPETPKKKEKTKRKTQSFSFKRLLRLLRSFQIKTCRINVDTGDYCVNGMLYPITIWTHRSGNYLRINFEGKQEIHLVITNRIYRLLTKTFF